MKKRLVSGMFAAALLMMGGTSVFAAEATSGVVRAVSPLNIQQVLRSKVEIDNVKSIQVVDDTFVMANNGEYTIEFFAPNGDTNLGSGKSRTFVGIYDAGRTSDPASGGNLQAGTIAAVPVFTSNTDGSVKIDTTSLAAGTYWLRFMTLLNDGTWEIAEGILMVH